MATERAWDPERPGCAFEECGGMSLDPCATIVRTRGRWHDGQVPETAAGAVASVLEGHFWSSGQCWNDLTTPCPAADLLDELSWYEHVAPLITAAVADWLRAKEGVRDNRAANLLDPGQPQ